MKAFDLLHRGVQKAIWDRGWKELHSIQSEAIETVYTSNDHLLISAQTAGGKTEAAFLPILSKIAESPKTSVQALYVGPLKALINDQFGRLDALCEATGIAVHRWHGDVGISEKHGVLKSPSGILLITPESLEAIFLRRGRQVPSLFAHLEFVVIDELHSFLDSVRGIHLQSLLSRIRTHAGCRPRMTGLSATLGSYEGAKRFLDIDAPEAVRLIQNPKSNREIRLGLKAFFRPLIIENESGDETLFSLPMEQVGMMTSDLTQTELTRPHPLKEKATSNPSFSARMCFEDDRDRLAVDIVRNFKDATNLIFGNSKSLIESLADKLHKAVEQEGLARDPFLIHHGSLSREQREDTENQLKESKTAVTAICSSTLEMGIDIANVHSVGQIQPPWSIASMMQRLGRSGRREGEAAILRMYTADRTLHSQSTLTDLFFPEVIQSIAMVDLMVAKWVESPEPDELNFSTFIHQTLSHLTQTGGLPAQALFEALIKEGPFRTITPDLFLRVLASLKNADLVETTAEGVLIVGLEGEKLTSSRDFYAAFWATPDYRVLHGQQQLGLLPANLVPPVGKSLLLGGKGWMVIEVRDRETVIEVVPVRTVESALFGGTGRGLHCRIAQQMKAVLLRDEIPSFLNPGARTLLGIARRVARLSKAVEGLGIVDQGGNVVVYPWSGTKVLTTLWAFAKAASLKVEFDSLSITYKDISTLALISHFQSILHSTVEPQVLAAQLGQKAVEKFDTYLEPSLLDLSNSQRLLDIPSTQAWLRELSLNNITSAS